MPVYNNLYPPILPDTMPAFIRTESCKVYFSLSIYNSIGDIKNAQVSVINLRTNTSALKKELYPSGIKIATIQDAIEEVDGNYNYYIEIRPDDLTDGAFNINEFYKVQIRFTSKMADDPPSGGLASWIINNLSYFSEWSKVCLIKGIERPHISIIGFDDTENNQQTVFTNPMIEIIGKMYFEENQNIEREYLKSYNIKLYQTDSPNNILLDSGDIYTNQYNPNQFDYELTYDLYDGVSYTLQFSYVTNNLYSETKKYHFNVIQYGIDKINADIFATPDEENGRMKIDIVAKDTQRFLGNLTIRRASSESNFHKWEDVHTITYKTGTELNYTWYDNTIQSGVWYKYCAQKRNIRGDRGVIIQIKSPVMCLFEDIFLSAQGKQLRVKFNPSLGDFKYNVAESQQATIGAKYPYVKRNGNNYYRTFSLGGLISSFIDTTDWYDPHFYDGEFHDDENELKLFTNKEQIYQESKRLYDNYNSTNQISEYQDYIYEREFRQKVYDFLYKHNVKLFRSMTEGNILIKLMDISFQPEASLGRRLYSFTATAIEVDEANIKNYNKYNIQSIGNYDSYIVYEHDVIGQLDEVFDSNSGNIIEEISGKYVNRFSDDFTGAVNGLKQLKIEINSDPYVIIETANGLQKADKTSDIDPSDATVGYIVEINGNEFIIPYSIQRNFEKVDPRSDGLNDVYYDNFASMPGSHTVYYGYFELKQEDTLIKSLKFKYPVKATIDYLAHVEETEDTSDLVSRVQYYKNPGQLYGTFNPGDSLVRKIYNKYFLQNEEFYQKLLDINNIKLEGNPGTVVYVKDSQDYNRHVLENGYLQLRDDDVNIEDFYFCGIHLTECKDPLQISTVNGLTEFTYQSGVYNSLNEIANPVNGGIYSIDVGEFNTEAEIDNNNILIVSDDLATHSEATPEEIQSLIANEYLYFVYYYGAWYTLKEGQEKIKLLKGDIRLSRQTECIPMEGIYNNLSEIENPVLNGVYEINTQNIDTSHIVYNYIFSKKYIDIIKEALKNNTCKFIYYQYKWYLFTTENDVLCPVDGIVDYTCEVVKGVY